MPEVQMRAGDAVNSVREQAARAREIVEQAAARAIASAEHARNVSPSLSNLAADTGSRAKDVSQRVSDDVVPSLRDVAYQAAAAALELWQVAREKAAEAATAAQNEVGSPSDLVSAAEKRARLATGFVTSHFDDVSDKASDASHLVADRVAEVGKSARDASETVTHRVEDAGGKVKDASAHAAEVTVAAGKDTGATILWGGAAAAVIFYVVLSEERREQLIRVAETVVGQTRELIRDFQGYDEDFA